MKFFVSKIIFLGILLNCQVSNPTLADEFVHGEITTRKMIIEKAFQLWKVRGQVELTKKTEDGQHRIVFTDTCEEDFIRSYKRTCLRLLSTSEAAGGCSFKPQKSIIIIRRTTYQALPQSQKIGVIAHEIGHCMGLNHSEDALDLMYPMIYEDNVTPREIEIAKLHSMWPTAHLFKFVLWDGY